MGPPGGAARCADMDMWPELPPDVSAVLTIVVVLALVSGAAAWAVSLFLGR